MRIFNILLPILLLTGCHPRSCILEPEIRYQASESLFDRKSSLFAPLSVEEQESHWGKEFLIATGFAKEFDFYRAITGYKRAIFLLSSSDMGRRSEIDFHIIQCYYLANKYCEVINTFEKSSLLNISSQFPAFRDLLIILEHSYRETGNCERAAQILTLIEKGDDEAALNIRLGIAILSGDLNCVKELGGQHPEQELVCGFLGNYCRCAKSVRTAQTLNGLLPGAGYYYVGQKHTALTSLLLNGLFIYTTYYFIHQGNIGAGIITGSLELGWYLGGINGAGLAAKEYNEKYYNCLGRDLMVRGKFFPVMQLGTSF